MAKVTWVEAQTLSIGQTVVLRRQELQVTKLEPKGQLITVTGKNEAGLKTVCVLVFDELVQKVLSNE